MAENCQILQTRVNRFKSDKQEVDDNQLKGYSCHIKFSGIYTLLRIFLLSFLASYVINIYVVCLSYRIDNTAKP